MPGWERWTGPQAIRTIRIASPRLFEERQKLRTGFLQLDQPHYLRLLGPRPVNGRFQDSSDLLPNQQRQKSAQNTAPRFEPAKDQGNKNDQNNERFPNLNIADCRHEQIQDRIRPLFVDQIKQALIHAAEF